MKRWPLAGGTATVVFGAPEAAWLTQVAKPLYEREVGRRFGRSRRRA